MSNKEIWEKLSKTDPKYTKNFKRAGGFSGTAQNPTYAIMKMTENFGSCGSGWGMGKPEFQTHDLGELGMLVFCTLSLWYMSGKERCEVFGVGGDSVVSKNKYGLSADDEAYKKAYTDAMTNAMKMIGMAADLHLGMFDDSKYVNTVAAEVKEKEEKEKAEKHKPEYTVDEIIEKVQQAQSVDALNGTLKMKEIKADLAHYGSCDKDGLDRIKEATAKMRERFATASVKKEESAPIDDEIVY